MLLFIDGRPLSQEIRSGDYVSHTGGWAPQPDIRLASTLQLGARNGEALFDELRISDVARYVELKEISHFQYQPQPFTPFRQRLSMDEHTLVLMHFDGDTKAESAVATKVEARMVTTGADGD